MDSKLSEADVAEWVEVLEHSVPPRRATPEGNGGGEESVPDVSLLPVDAQLQILRQQLEDAFAEVDTHIAALGERIEQGEARASAAEARAESADALVGDLVVSLRQLSHELSRLDPYGNRPELEALRSFVKRVHDRLPTA